MQHLEVVECAAGRIVVRAEVAVRVGRIEKVLGAVLVDLRAAELHNEGVVDAGFCVAEIEVVEALPVPGFERI